MDGAGPSHAIANDDAIDNQAGVFPAIAAVDGLDGQNENDYSVVKMKLNSFITNAALAASIRRCVFDMDRIVAEGYAFANFHIARLLRKGLSIPIIDRNFYYRCLVAVSNTHARSDTLGADFKVSVTEFDSLRPPIRPANVQTLAPEAPAALGNVVKQKGRAKAKKSSKTKKPKAKKVWVTHAGKVDAIHYNQVIADCSITMAAMATNHLWMNLDKRLQLYLEWSRPHLKAMHASIVRAVTMQPNVPVDAVIKQSALDKSFATAGAKNDGDETKQKKKKKKHAPSTAEKRAALVEEARALSMELRALMPLPKPNRYANQAHMTLPLYRKLLDETEAALADHIRRRTEDPDAVGDKRFRGRLFTLLPTKSGFTASHVPISTAMLRALLKATGLEDFGGGDGRNIPSRTFWNKYFNLKTVETRNRTFGDRICTDGYAVGIMMTTRAASGSKASDADMDVIRDRIESGGDVETVAIDPGFDDVFVAAYTDDSIASMSSKEYYHVSKVNYSKRFTKIWNAENITQVEGADENDKTQIGPAPPGRGMTVREGAMNAYVSWFLKAFPALQFHRALRGYRRLRFTRYVHKQLALEMMCDRIAPRVKGRDVTYLVGFGDWKAPANSPISRKTVGPISELKAMLQRRSNVLFRHVSEFRTSQRDCKTWMQLTNMKAETVRKKKTKEGETKRVTTFGRVHKVLHCRNSEGKLPSGSRRETTRNRDVNAACNMLLLFTIEIQGGERPEPFQRPPRVNDRAA